MVCIFSSALRFPFMTSNLPESPLFSSSLCGIVEGRLRGGSVKAVWAPFHFTRPLRSAAQKAALGRTLGLSATRWRVEESAWPVQSWGVEGVVLHRPSGQPRVAPPGTETISFFFKEIQQRCHPRLLTGTTWELSKAAGTWAPPHNS